MNGTLVGSTEVENGAITYVIDDLPVGIHNFDIKMVLEYLKNEDVQRYRELIAKLGLRK